MQIEFLRVVFYSSSVEKTLKNARNKKKQYHRGGCRWRTSPVFSGCARLLSALHLTPVRTWCSRKLPLATKRKYLRMVSSGPETKHTPMCLYEKVVLLSTRSTTPCKQIGLKAATSKSQSWNSSVINDIISECKRKYPPFFIQVRSVEYY